MDNKLDAFLFDRLDVYARLEKAKEEVEGRFWPAFGSTIVTIAEELLGDEFVASCPDGQTSIYNSAWILELDRELPENERGPSLWLPQEYRASAYDMIRFFHLDDRPRLHACLFAGPHSEFMGELEPVRNAWDKSVAAMLRERGWTSYGTKATKPNGDWGMSHVVELDHHQVAQGLKEGDLRIALQPIEQLIQDFKDVSPAIGQLVDELRAKKQHADPA